MTASEKNLSEISGNSGAGGTNGTTGKSAASVSSQDLAEIVSSNLKKLIAQQGITQKDLADLLCVAPASMTDYCKGRRILGTEHLLRLKKHFDISIDDFLTKSITPSAVTVVPRSAGIVLHVLF